jgi:hypothetical protein
MQFIPEQPRAVKQEIKYFEDVKAKDAPGYSTTKKPDALQREITELIYRLNGQGVIFTPGQYPTVPQRYGFQITFLMGNIKGRIDCAALPLRSETPLKKSQALAQALYLVRQWLEAEVFSSIYRPGSMPLVPYLIGSGGKTVLEGLIESQVLPMALLPGDLEIVEAELVE